MKLRKSSMSIGFLCLLMLSGVSCSDTNSGGGSNAKGIPAGTYVFKSTETFFGKPSADATITIKDGKSFTASAYPASTYAAGFDPVYEYVKDDGQGSWIYKVTARETADANTDVVVYGRFTIQSDKKVNMYGCVKTTNATAASVEGHDATALFMEPKTT